MDSGIGGAFRILMSSVEGVAIAVGEALDTSIASMASAVSRALSNLTEWIGKNQAVVKSVALVVVGVVAAGAAFIGIGTAAGIAAFAIGGIAAMFSLVGSTIGALVGLIGALFTPLGAVVAAVAAIGAYFLYSSGIAGQAIDYLKSLFETLKADTLKVFGAIANALKAGDITAAANVLWSYLKLQWAKGTGWLSDQWSAMTGQIADTWDSLTYGLSRVLINSLATVENAWVESIDFLADGWSVFVAQVKSMWNSTVGLLQKAWIELKSLFDDSIDVTLELQKIDQEVADNKAASEKQNLDAIAARMKARADRKRQIESDRQQMVGNLNEDQQRRKDRRAQDQSQSASTIAAAQAEFDAATTAANQLGGEATEQGQEQSKPPEPPELPEIKPPDIKPLDLSTEAEGKIDEFTEGPKSDITGDFSGTGQSMGSSVSDLSSFLAKQLSGLRYTNLGLPSAPVVNQKQGYQASGSLSDDVQRAMIDTAKHTADLVRMAKEGGLVFG